MANDTERWEAAGVIPESQEDELDRDLQAIRAERAEKRSRTRYLFAIGAVVIFVIFISQLGCITNNP